MNARIVRVTPAEEYFSINWQLAMRCNYDCMYCAPAWHNNYSKHHDLKTMQDAWHNVFEQTKHHGLQYKIAFTGGELTTNKHFLPFVTWLRSNYHSYLFRLLTTTNGSASLRYYLKMFEALDNIAFSVHSEHIDEQKFFDMIISLRKRIAQDRFLQVIIMDEWWNRDRIPRYVDLLEKNKISYTINKIDHSHQTRSMPILKGNLNLAI